MLTVYQRALITHLRKYHKIYEPLIRKHYLDKKVENQMIIEDVINRCFDGAKPFNKMETRPNKSASIKYKNVKCNKCIMSLYQIWTRAY